MSTHTCMTCGESHFATRASSPDPSRWCSYECAPDLADAAPERIAALEKEVTRLNIKSHDIGVECDELEAKVEDLRTQRDELEDWLGQLANYAGTEDTPEDQIDVNLIGAAISDMKGAYLQRDELEKEVERLTSLTPDIVNYQDEHEIPALRAQRDELLKALRALYSASNLDYTPLHVYTNARAAIANAEKTEVKS